MPYQFKAAPVLASLNIAKTVNFYQSKLGFSVGYQDENYAVIQRENLVIHFWLCDNKIFPENTSCYVYLESQIDEWYAALSEAGVIHPNGKLEDKPWGMREFAILDEDGNMIKFGMNI